MRKRGRSVLRVRQRLRTPPAQLRIGRAAAPASFTWSTHRAAPWRAANAGAHNGLGQFAQRGGRCGHNLFFNRRRRGARRWYTPPDWADLPAPGRQATRPQKQVRVPPSLPDVHFGAVVADAPSPLSTPRCATGQAQLRLGKPLRMKCRASPVLLFMRAGRVVSGTVGIVRATVPFHGEHDAPEPTKGVCVLRTGRGARKRARSRTLTTHT